MPYFTRYPRDLSGLRFHRWTVVSLIPAEQHGQRGRSLYLCRCDCGTERSVLRASLTQGTSKSCGCHKSEVVARMNTTHGLSKDRTYSIWRDMIRRCHDPSDGYYHNYGKRGIHVCERWRGSFEAFVEDMGVRPGRGYSIERRNNNAGYCPENCCWATRKEQMRNTRQNRNITYRGETLTLIEWSEKTGINYDTLKNRLDSGFPLSRVFEKTNFRYIYITHQGETHSLKEWSMKTGIKYATLQWRRLQGWPVERILAK